TISRVSLLYKSLSFYTVPYLDYFMALFERRGLEGRMEKNFTRELYHNAWALGANAIHGVTKFDFTPDGWLYMGKVDFYKLR
ncbi:MAG: hypothetical protein ACE5FT_07345, partial [Candidatus Nanoarchaeia archaeon]